jgi:hypothetical protein
MADSASPMEKTSPISRKAHEKIELAGLTRFEIDYGVIPPREISEVD